MDPANMHYIIVFIGHPLDRKKMGFAGFFGSIPKEPMARISFQLAHISTWVFPRTDKLLYLMLPFTSVVAALWAPVCISGQTLITLLDISNSPYFLILLSSFCPKYYGPSGYLPLG